VSASEARPIRIVVAKVGLDGHDRGIRVVARALREAGMEVIYLGLRQTPEMVAEAALEEDADAVGISILSAAHMTIFPRILAELEKRGLDHVLLTGGGIFPPEDKSELKALGVGELFEPGDTMQKFVDYIREEVLRRRARRAGGRAGEKSFAAGASRATPAARGKARGAS
jgi:methylmalonyl-CoA mutase C-terminal domain/subunit